MAEGTRNSIRPIQELHPQLSSLHMTSDDDESFIVLQKDADFDVDYPSTMDSLQPLSTTQTEEIKKLIDVQLKSIEATTRNEENQTSFQHVNGHDDTIYSKSWYEDVQKQVETLVKENSLLKETLAQNNLKLSSQKEKLLKWQEDVERINRAHKDKLLEAKSLIDKLEDENRRLTGDIEKLGEIRKLQDDELIEMKLKQKSLTEVMSQKQTVDLINDTNLKKIEELECKMADLKKLLELRTLDNVRLQADNQKLQNYSIVDSHSELSAAINAVETLKIKLATSEQEVRTLKDEIQKLAPSMQDAYQKQKEQLTAAQIKITELKEQIELKTRDFNDLSERCNVHQTEMEEIDILRQQVDVYKEDFEAELSAKNSIKQERDQLLEDLQNLQRRNSQLQEELEIVRDAKNFVVLPQTAASSSRRGGPDTWNEEVFTCPNCPFAFNNYQALDNHVQKCLKLLDL